MDSTLGCQALFTVTSPALILRKLSPRGVKRRGSLEHDTKDTLRDETQEGKLSSAFPLERSTAPESGPRDPQKHEGDT